jgi:hypothetical protein
MKLKVFTLASVVAALALGVAGAGTAAADNSGAPVSDAGVIVFTGQANLSTPIQPPPSTGGGGSFTFGGSSAACVIVSDGDVSPLTTPEVGNCTTISASGSFSNIVCGTGTATGTGTVTTSDGTITVHFTIVFVAGVGTLVVDSASSDGAGDPTDVDPAGVGAGVVLLTNTTPGQTECTGPVTSFNIDGTASVALLEQAV